MLHELTRLRAEYLDMLKREQVQGLYGLEGPVCERLLNTLAETRFLYLKADGTYARLMDRVRNPRTPPGQQTTNR